MAYYTCKIEVTVDDDSEEDAKEQAWEIIDDDTLGHLMKVELDEE